MANANAAPKSHGGLQLGKWESMRDYLAERTKFRTSPYRPEPEDQEDITGKIVIVTGCNTGIGKTTVAELAKKGAKIIMACRDLKKAQDAMEDIKAATPEAQLEVMQLDIGDFEGVKKFVQVFTLKYTHLNILINNAGINKDSEISHTKDDHEINMHVNHLGPFLLTNLLSEHLKKGAPSRVVMLASLSHIYSNLDLDDLMMKKYKGTVGILPYANSKLANILFTKEYGNRMKDSGVHIYALCPGVVATEIGRNASWHVAMIRGFFRSFTVLTPEEGARTTVYCAISKTAGKDTGKMYRFCQVWEQATNALNEDMARKLWEMSEELVDLKSSTSK